MTGDIIDGFLSSKDFGCQAQILVSGIERDSIKAGHNDLKSTGKHTIS